MIHFFIIFLLNYVVAMICGLFGALGLSASCLIAGVMMMYVYLFFETIRQFIFFSFLGFALIMFEVPICCQFVQYTQPVAAFSQQRPPWQKAILYTLFVN